MIPYRVEPGHFGDVAEPCCFCREPTRCRTSLPDRSESEQVACCVLCSREKRPVQVPSKQAWLDLKIARERARGIRGSLWPFRKRLLD